MATSSGAVIARIISQYSDKGTKAAQKDIAKMGKQIDAWSKKVVKSYAVAGVAAAAFAYLANAPMGGGFVMLPSYRIPVAWEQFMIEFLEVLFEK